MKRLICVFFLLALLTACASQTLPDDWDESWTRVGPFLGVEPVMAFTPAENMDVLEASGLYYATWTAGAPQPYTNADGDEVQLYDAEIYVLLLQCRNAEAALAELEEWRALEEQSYLTGEMQSVTCAEQSFEIVPLLQSAADNPYTHGVAALGARGEWAISVELLCQDSFPADVTDSLTEFLSTFHYNDE